MDPVTSACGNDMRRIKAKWQKCGFARVLPLFHVRGQAANQRQRVEKTLAQDTLRSMSQVHPSSPYHPLKHQQESRNQCGCVCLPWCWAERPKKAWALHLIHINWLWIQYIHVGAPLTSPRNNMHKDISLASLVLSDSVLPNPSQSLEVCHGLPPVLSKNISRSNDLSNCADSNAFVSCFSTKSLLHWGDDQEEKTWTVNPWKSQTITNKWTGMEQVRLHTFAVPHNCNSQLPCGAPNPHIHKPSVPFLLELRAIKLQTNSHRTVYCRQTQAKTCLGGGTNTSTRRHKPWLRTHTRLEVEKAHAPYVIIYVDIVYNISHRICVSTQPCNLQVRVLATCTTLQFLNICTRAKTWYMDV